MENTAPQIEALRHRNGKWERIALPAMPYRDAIKLAERGDLTGESCHLGLYGCLTAQLDEAAIYLYDGYSGSIQWQEVVRPGVPFDSSASELERQQFAAFLAEERVETVRKAMEADWCVAEIDGLLPSLSNVEQFAPRAERLAAKNATPVPTTIWDEAAGYDNWDTAVALLGKIEIAIAWQRMDSDLGTDYHCSFDELCATQGVELSDWAREVYATLEDRPSMGGGDPESCVSGMRYGPWRRVDGLPLNETE